MDHTQPLGVAVVRRANLHVGWMLDAKFAAMLRGTALARRQGSSRSKRRIKMTIERGLRLIAGAVVLTSVSLAVLHSPYWLALNAFVGLNLMQSAFTNWCPMVWILGRMGMKPCVAHSR
jgi:hypothetical protein